MYHQSTASYSYGAPPNDMYPREYWPQPQGSSHPRSVPTPPIPNQPVKKTRVSTTPEPYYSSESRRQDRRVTSPQGATASPSKEEPRGLPLVYDDNTYGYYADEEYPLSATTTSSSGDYYWDHQYGSPRDGQDRRTSNSLFSPEATCGFSTNWE
jgi:hypothetical protein